MKNIIDIKSLTKKFGSFIAVDDLHLTVKEGEIFGFLGPNGAGKTTTISMLTTLIRPTSGVASVGGYDVFTQGVKIREIIGVVPQTFALFPELTAQENLEYIGKLYGLSRQVIKERSEYLLKTVALFEQKDRIAGVFSGGMKQRLSLAASIISSPKLLFMDEPTTGLDPQSRLAMRDLTRKLNRDGMTVVYTTHDMDEADKLCDRITIMDKGKIVANGTGSELKNMVTAEKVVEIRIESPSKEIISELKKLSYVSKISEEKNIILLHVSTKENVFYRLSDFFHKRGKKVDEIRFREHTLEDVFIHLTKKDLRD